MEYWFFQYFVCSVLIEYVFVLTGRQNYPIGSLLSPLEGGGQSENWERQQSRGYPHRKYHCVLR